MDFHAEQCRVTYHSPGKTDRSAMPIGGGELAASVWCDRKGVRAYLSRSDALTEWDRTVKLCRLDVRLEPCPFTGTDFVQTLELERGVIAIQAGDCRLTVFADREQPVLYLQLHTDTPRRITARLVTWRTRPLTHRLYTCPETADVLLSDTDAVTVLHENGETMLAQTAALQGLGDRMDAIPDRLTGRVFGARLVSDQPLSVRENALVGTATEVCLRVLTASELGGRSAFFSALERLTAALPTPAEALSRTARWWQDYWQQSYIEVSGDPERQADIEPAVAAAVGETTGYTCPCPSAVTRAYTLTRYMFACCSTGAFPVLYNGMLFSLMPGGGEHFGYSTFGTSYTAQPTGAPTPELNPDERSWCTEHLWQNLRHPYHSLLARRETEPFRALFAYFRPFWELDRLRAARYYGAAGQHSTEMTLSCGLQTMEIYGADREKLALGYAENRSGGAVDISPGLERIFLMLDYVDFTHDRQLLTDYVLPYTKELLEYIRTRFPNRHAGRIVLGPLQSVETYWDTIDPAPTVAGMRAVVERLLHTDGVDAAMRHYLTDYRALLPELPIEVADGHPVLAPATAYSAVRRNVEQPALYAVFPFRLYGIGKPELALARDTFWREVTLAGADRPFRIGETPGAPSYSGWQYVGVCAALLGMADKAGEILAENCALRNPGTRFPAMWGPIYDAVPDTDHGANILTLLQQMVLQTEGKTIRLLPAFPREWSVRFKLWADRDTCVEAEYTAGRLTAWRITPDSRRSDVIVPPDNA